LFPWGVCAKETQQVHPDVDWSQISVNAPSNIPQCKSKDTDLLSWLSQSQPKQGVVQPIQKVTQSKQDDTDISKYLDLEAIEEMLQDDDYEKENGDSIGSEFRDFIVPDHESVGEFENMDIDGTSSSLYFCGGLADWRRRVAAAGSCRVEHRASD